MTRSRWRRGAWLAWALASAPAGAEITTDGSFGAAGPILPVGSEYQILDSYGRYSGPNLFHSFGLFGIEVGKTAIFSAENGAPLRIIARVTGGSPSLIDGTLRTIGGAEGADVYLLNPSGITFGPTSRVDVEGSLHLSTAERLRFENDPGSAFDLDTTSFAPDPPLSIEHPSAFGFLGTSGVRPEIRFNRVVQPFVLPPGETFSAVGGTVSLIGADGLAISVPSGRVHLASVDGPVDVPVKALESLGGEELAAGVDADSLPVELRRGFDIDVSGALLSTAPAGRVVIRGGGLVVENSDIEAFHRSDTDAAGPAIDVEVVGDVKLAAGGLLATRSNALGRSGGTAVVAGRLEIDGMTSGVESLSRAAGEGGPVSLRVTDLVVTNRGRVFSGSEAAGAGGRIEIVATNVDATAGGQILSLASGGGAGGEILILADRVFVSNESDAPDPAAIASVVASGATGQGGDLGIETRELEVVEGGGVSTRTEGAGPGGNLAVVATERVKLEGVDALGARAALTAFTTLGSTGSGGALSVDASVVEVLNGGQISTSTQGSGDGSALEIRASERVTVRGGANGPSFVSSDSRLVAGALVAPGAGGDVGIQTQLLELLDGGRVTASTDWIRDAGIVRITADEVVISGVDPTAEANPSVVQSRSNAGGGDGGAIEIVASGDVIVSNRGEIASSTAAEGDAGTIDVLAGGRLVLEDQASIAARTEGESTGNGGAVRLEGRRGVSITRDSLVASESLGLGTAGDITIDAGPSLLVADNSAITTLAERSSGGRITIIADQIVHLQSSELITSVDNGAGGGGDISIDPEFVVLDQSQILAQAEFGEGGNITITAGTYFATPDSVVNADSELGIDGTISIVAPDTDVTSGITTLPSDVLDATALMRTACAAATAEAGSFVVSGRYPGLPVHPDGLLAAFDAAGGPAAVAVPGPASEAAARVALAGPFPAQGCSRAQEEVL